MCSVVSTVGCDNNRKASIAILILIRYLSDCFSLRHPLLLFGELLLAECDVLRYLVDVRVSVKIYSRYTLTTNFAEFYLNNRITVIPMRMCVCV